MQKEEFGKICASLRKDIYNHIKGRACSQEELAELSNLTTSIIGQIERGEKAHLDKDILMSLADAYGLTTIECQRFQDCLARNTLQFSSIPREAMASLQSLQQPMMLHDGLYRIVSINSAFLEIYGLTTEFLDSINDNDPSKYHIVRHIHDPRSPIREVYKNQIGAIEINNVIYWRYFSLHHRHKKLFHEIQSSLFKACPNFPHLWNRLNDKALDQDMTNLLRNYDSNHPRLGQLKYMGITTNLCQHGDEIFLATLLPADSQTHHAFDELLKPNHLEVIHCPHAGAPEQSTNL